MPRSDDDAQTGLLLERARDGDPGALDTLFDRHLTGLRAFVRLQSNEAIRNRESCTDIVQSVCREALQNLENFDYRGEGSFRSWLYKRALNKVRNRARHWQATKRNVAREVPLGSDAPAAAGLCDAYADFCTPSHCATVRERIEQVERAMDRLPEHYRDVIIQARVVGLSSAEIAQETGKTEEAVRQLLHRATVRLATELDLGSE